MIRRLVLGIATFVLTLVAASRTNAEVRTHFDLGVGSYQGSYIRHDTINAANAPRRDHDTSVAYNGIGIGLDLGALFKLTPRFRIGPAAGLTFVPAGANDGNLCCASIKWVIAPRLGPELEFTPDPSIGFHVRAGFGFTLVKPKISTTNPTVDATVRNDSFTGLYATIAVVRTTKLNDDWSIGGVLRLDVARAYGRGTDFDGPYSSRWTSLAPSLAFTAQHH